MAPAAAFAQHQDAGRVASEPPLPIVDDAGAYGGDLARRPFLLGDPAGARTWAAERGIRLEAGLIADSSVILDGGADQDASAFRHLFVVELSIDAEPLLDWAGGEFFASFVTQNGEDGSEEAGDFQAFSNIDALGFTAVYELWYQQALLDGRLRVKAGKIDANSEFDYVEHGGEFIHSSPGFSPTLLSLPSYPNPATGMVLFLYERDAEEPGWYAGAGVFDGALQEGIATGTRGPSTLFGSPADLYLIGEAGYRWEVTGGLPGRVGLGVWHHTGTFERFDGGEEDGATGVFAVLDQMIWRPGSQERDDPRGIGLFLQYGYADDEVSEVDHHGGAGLAWTGPIPGRSDDVAGVMASYVRFSRIGGFADDFELAIEGFYKVQITPWISVKPDLQCIVNPGGDGLDDALVGTVRLEVAF